LIVNVPFTTVLLTHGAILLFLLWYITPFRDERRAKQDQPAATSPASG
jgi:hypothetical protein